MEMCKGLREQIEYDAKGLTCLGELSERDMGGLIRDMVETAKDFIDEIFADEMTGSHGDLFPMTDEAGEQMSKITMQQGNAQSRNPSAKRG